MSKHQRKHRGPELSDTEQEKSSTTTPTTNSESVTRDGTKSINTSDMNSKTDQQTNNQQTQNKNVPNLKAGTPSGPPVGGIPKESAKKNHSESVSLDGIKSMNTSNMTGKRDQLTNNQPIPNRNVANPKAGTPSGPPVGGIPKSTVEKEHSESATKSMNTSDMKGKTHQQTNNQPTPNKNVPHHKTGAPSALPVGRIPKSATKKDYYLGPSNDENDTENGAREATYNHRNEVANRDTEKRNENLPDMKNEETQTDVTKTNNKQGNTDDLEIEQNDKHEEAVKGRAQDGHPNNTVREQYDNDYEEFHEQHQVYSRDRPESRPKSRRTLNTDTSRKESVPKGTNETPVEGKRNMEDKKGTVMGIGLDQLLTCGSVILCAILAYFVYNTNQQIEELKERLDKVPKTDDSVSIEKIQSMIMKETERMEKPLKLEIRDLRQNLMKEVTSKNSLEAGMVMLKAQQEKQGQKEELLTKTIEELKSDIKEWSDKFHALGNVISEINSTVKDHGKAADALRQEQKVMKESLEQTKNKVNDMKSRLTDHQRDIHEKSEEIRERMAKADEDLKVFEKQMLSTTEKLQRHDKELDTAFDHLFNKKVAIAVITFMLFVLIVLVISVYKLCQNQTKSGSLAHGRSSQNGITGKNFSPVLEDVPFNPRLRPALGVISFSKEYQGLHRKLVQSVRANFQNGFEVEYCIIRDNIDIPNIPHCQLIVIFVEHTDRYVILEEEGDGLGNRNRVTLTAVKQIGAVPVIVYDNDPGSQRLAKDQLYSKEIWGAKVQEELMELSNCGRLFSVYETLSKSQELGLKKLIEDHALKSKTF